MALGSSTPRRKMYYCGIRSTREITNPQNPTGNKIKVVDPHITVQTKNEDGNMMTLKDEKAVSGWLIKIADGKYTHQNKDIQKIMLHLIDQNDEFKVEMNLNNAMARSLINKMIALNEEIGWIEIRVYKQKAKEAGREDVASMWISNNGEPMGWKYQYKRTEDTAAEDIILADMVEEAVDPQDPKKKQKIYHKLNAFLIKEWREFAHVVSANAKTKGWDWNAPPPAPTGRPGQPAVGVKTETSAPAPGSSVAVQAPDHHEQEPGPEHQEPVTLSPDGDDLPF